MKANPVKQGYRHLSLLLPLGLAEEQARLALASHEHEEELRGVTHDILHAPEIIKLRIKLLTTFSWRDYQTNKDNPNYDPTQDYNWPGTPLRSIREYEWDSFDEEEYHQPGKVWDSEDEWVRKYSKWIYQWNVVYATLTICQMLCCFTNSFACNDN